MRILFISAIICLLLGTVDAQVKLHVNINIGNQPAWGPSGYNYVDYYYLPDYDVFYYVPSHRFVYFDDGRWVFRRALPPRFGHVDLYTVHKVVINENRPYLRHEYYRDNYRRYIGMHDQRPIREYHSANRNFDRNRGGHFDNGHGRRDVGRGHSEDHRDHNDRGNREHNKHR